MTRRVLLLVVILPVALLLAAVAALPVLGGGGCHGTGAAATEAGSTVVKIDGCTFVPTVARVPVGTTVTFLNSGTGPHDVSGSSGTWGSRMLEPGTSYAMRFAAPGVYPYSCSLHPGMAGVVVAESDAQPVSALVDAAAAPPEAAAEPAEPAGSPIAVVAVGGAGLLAGVIGSELIRRRREPAA